MAPLFPGTAEGGRRLDVGTGKENVENAKTDGRGTIATDGNPADPAADAGAPPPAPPPFASSGGLKQRQLVSNPVGGAAKRRRHHRAGEVDLTDDALLPDGYLLSPYATQMDVDDVLEDDEHGVGGGVDVTWKSASPPRYRPGYYNGQGLAISSSSAGQHEGVGPEGGIVVGGASRDEDQDPGGVDGSARGEQNVRVPSRAGGAVVNQLLPWEGATRRRYIRQRCGWRRRMCDSSTPQVFTGLG